MMIIVLMVLVLMIPVIVGALQSVVQLMTAISSSRRRSV
jgi:hypothetical protein